jgi:hypothetical protein
MDTTVSSFTARNNAKRAAEKMIANGKATGNEPAASSVPASGAPEPDNKWPDGTRVMVRNKPKSLMTQTVTGRVHMPTLHGSCLCRGVRFEITGPLRPARNCHCSMGRKQQGAAFRSAARISSADLRWDPRRRSGQILRVVSRHVPRLLWRLWLPDHQQVRRAIGRAADRVVQRMPAPGRTRPRRAGPALWRRDQRSRLARPASLLAVREPTGRHGGQRDQPAVIGLRGFYGRRAENALASPEAKTRRCLVGVIETSAALGACLLMLAVAVALDRVPARQAKLHSDNDHRGRGDLGAWAASAEFDGVQLIMPFI